MKSRKEDNNRYLLLLILLLVSVSNISIAQHIEWLSLDEAIKKNEEEPRPILMDVYTNWCGPCKYMEKVTFGNKDVIEYVSDHFYAVKFNAEGKETVQYDGRIYDNPKYQESRANSRNGTHQFARYLSINAYPTVIFMDKNSNPLLPLVGVNTPSQIEFYLKMVAEEKYKKFKTQDEMVDYQNNFKSTFTQ